MSASQNEYLISVHHRDILYALTVLKVKEVRMINTRMYFLSSRFERTELTRRGIAYTIGGYSRVS